MYEKNNLKFKIDGIVAILSYSYLEASSNEARLHVNPYQKKKLTFRDSQNN